MVAVAQCWAKIVMLQNPNANTNHTLVCRALEWGTDPKYALGHRLRVWPILFTGAAGILADDYIMSQYCSRFARHQVQQGQTVAKFYSPFASDKPERTLAELGPFRITTREGTPTCMRSGGVCGCAAQHGVACAGVTNFRVSIHAMFCLLRCATFDLRCARTHTCTHTCTCICSRSRISLIKRGHPASMSHMS